MQNSKSSFSSAQISFKISSKGGRDSHFRPKRYHRVPLDCSHRFRNEFQLRRFGLTEKRPTKFATTSWLESQIPYVLYRALLLVYCISVLSWKASYETNYSNVEKWLLSLPTWTFILFTFYNFLLFIFTVLQFFHDCLCNDDLSWYHKLAWVSQSAVSNWALLCCFGSIIYVSAVSAKDIATQEIFEIFMSDNVNFTYVIGMLIIVEIFLNNITVRLLHFVYPMIFYIFLIAFNVYRWGAGYTPVFKVFDYGSHPSTSIAFIFIVLFLVSPFLHLVSFGIDTLRWTLLLRCIERHRKRFLEVASATEGTTSYALARSSLSTRLLHTSSRVCPTSTDTFQSDPTPNDKPEPTAMERLFFDGRLAYY